MAERQFVSHSESVRNPLVFFAFLILMAGFLTRLQAQFADDVYDKYTSVGQDAIQRFVHPIAFQSCPAALLPSALQDENPLGIWRWVDGVWTNKTIDSK